MLPYIGLATGPTCVAARWCSRGGCCMPQAAICGRAILIFCCMLWSRAAVSFAATHHIQPAQHHV